MDDFVDIFAQRLLQYNKYARTVRAVEKSMSQYGITRPLTIEYKNVLSVLPKTPVRQEGEILRQLNCSKFPKTEHEIGHKLHDLYVYSNMGKSLKSDAITHAVMKTLKAIETEIPPPGKRQVPSTTITNDSSANPKRKPSKSLEVQERIRKDIDKYSQVGEIKKKLYSMPDYIHNRDRKGVKLPQSKINSASHRLNLNISKVRGLNTKIGRVILRQEAKCKSIEKLKQSLNPVSKKKK